MFYGLLSEIQRGGRIYIRGSTFARLQRGTWISPFSICEPSSASPTTDKSEYTPTKNPADHLCFISLPSFIAFGDFHQHRSRKEIQNAWLIGY
ncbi:hypothetical protein L1887_24496 [Cichorium endivia]|nr:hypothetical protein L1887_24496 [Cichorium endivia]